MPHRELLGIRQPGHDQRHARHAKRRESHEAASIIAVGERASGKSYHEVGCGAYGKDYAHHAFRVSQGQHHPAEQDLLHP
jgi:hypothetical protein